MSPAFLLHLCEAANYALCGITSIFEAHAGRQVLLDLLLQVKLQFGVEFLLEAAPTNQ